MTQGFESYNKFKANLVDSRQLYDITFHLYQSERGRLKVELKKSNNKDETLNTSVGSIEHSTTALYQKLESSYPYKLRQLILISTITALEVYLTDVILEIFSRDISPFKKDEPITLQKNYLLSLASINKLHEDLIKKDFRNLTSGGLTQIEKYFKKVFEISLRNTPVPFKDIEEIHIRRHLFVHRNGAVDIEYVTKFPTYNFKVGEIMKLEHKYLIDSLNKLQQFAGAINKALLSKYPITKRKPKYIKGDANYNSDLKNLMLEIGILHEKFDHVDFLQNLKVRDLKFSNYITQIVTVDNTCFVFLSGKQYELSTFYNILTEHKSLILNKTIEINKQ